MAEVDPLRQVAYIAHQFFGCQDASSADASSAQSGKPFCLLAESYGSLRIFFGSRSYRKRFHYHGVASSVITGAFGDSSVTWI
jgi:hypothetical protein